MYTNGLLQWMKAPLFFCMYMYMYVVAGFVIVCVMHSLIQIHFSRVHLSSLFCSAATGCGYRERQAHQAGNSFLGTHDARLLSITCTFQSDFMSEQ